MCFKPSTPALSKTGKPPDTDLPAPGPDSRPSVEPSVNDFNTNSCVFFLATPFVAPATAFDALVWWTRICCVSRPRV